MQPKFSNASISMREVIINSTKVLNQKNQFFEWWSWFNHGTIIRTGITCKKIPCYMRDSACRWFIVENAKIFRSYVEHF